MKRATKDWEEIEVSDLSDSHIANIYAMIERMETTWYIIRSRWWWPDWDDYRYDEEIYYWEDVRKQEEVFEEIRREFNMRLKNVKIDNV